MANAFVTDAAKGLTIERPLTAEEQANLEAIQAAAEAEAQANADRQALKEATLAKLGLTADEVAALLS
jgi:adenosylcobinamide amidohydrolase